MVASRPPESPPRDTPPRPNLQARLTTAACLASILALVVACSEATEGFVVAKTDATAIDGGMLEGSVEYVTGTVCPAGTFRETSERDGEADDGTCMTCPPGTFSTAPNASACKPWSTCAPTTRIAISGSSTTDRTCAPCESGTTTSAPNELECTAIPPCPAGSERAAEGQCEPCGVGHYCAGGNEKKAECSPGTWDNDANAATQCIAWTDCVEGKYVTSEGTSSTDRQCGPCDAGSFTTGLNSTACTTHTSCPAGTFVFQPGTTTADRLCAPCAEGTYSDLVNSASCLPLGACGPGTVQTEAATPTSNAKCDPCSPGFYCAGSTTQPVECNEGTWDDDGDPATACVPWRECHPGESVVSSGNTLEDRQCSPCSVGTFSVATNAASCASWSSCEPRSYVSTDGTAVTDRTCAACPSGTTSFAPNQPSCVPLPTNAVSVGKAHLCTRDTAGVLRCWGAGRGTDNGATLGTGNYTNVSSPTVIDSTETYLWPTVGENGSCGVTADSRVRCWGSPPGDGIGSNTFSPAFVADLERYVMVTSGSYHVCGITTRSAVKCWGDNFGRKLGDLAFGPHASAPRANAPRTALEGTSFRWVTAGRNHTCAITTSGALKCWGNNGFGQLGNGTTLTTGADAFQVADVDSSETYNFVSAGENNTCAVTSLGTLKCWGANTSTQIGDGTSTLRSSPTPIDTGTSYTTVSVAQSGSHACAITTAGSLKCWGLNTSRQLGDGTVTNRSTPTEIDAGVAYRTVSCGRLYTCGVTTTGVLKCWGTLLEVATPLPTAIAGIY
jgi:alpha-tubulin suppressor-like RCC1 family protein